MTWEPGDVLITNDPTRRGGMVMHLNDIYVFRPVFVDGRLLCFAWAFIHCTDVGGYAPGSIDMQNSRGVPGRACGCGRSSCSAAAS